MMIVKVKKFNTSKETRQAQAISSIKQVRVVKLTAQLETKSEVKPSVMKRVTFLRPLTEVHARTAWNQLFA